MSKLILAVLFLALGVAGLSAAQPKFEKDVIPTSKGDLEITFLGHETLMMTFGGKTIHVDPYGDVADYGSLPKADLVLVPTSISTISIKTPAGRSARRGPRSWRRRPAPRRSRTP